MFITFQPPFPSSSLSAPTSPSMDLQHTLDHKLEEQRRLFALLGCTVAEFALLESDMRKEIYRTHLLRDDAILNMLDDGPDFTDMPNGTMLLHEYYMGRDETGRLLVKEAREFFYRENTFAVPSHRLVDFMQDPLVDGKPVEVAQLVKGITVRVYDVDSPAGPKEDEVKWKGLHHLSQFPTATPIDIELQVGGAINGMDLTTQQMIRDISGVVKGLIGRFGDGLSIRTESVVSLMICNIRPYWDAPEVDAVERLRRGLDYSFKELMQIQIAKWTGVLPEVLDANGELVPLL